MQITTPTLAERRRIVVAGLVQGVGFRPFVYRLARDCGLSGWVRNTGAGVEMEMEGEPGDLERFAVRLAREAPTLARIEGLEIASIEPTGAGALEILPSAPPAGEPLPVSPDAAVCAACLAEVHDPRARRYLYPFANCTECGPRFTIIERLPYDRERTAMAAFPLCDACRAEYSDPADRRFHAEPIACPACGPRLRYVEADAAVEPGVESIVLIDEPAAGVWEIGLDGGTVAAGSTPADGSGPDALERAIAALAGGGIVAVKGLGGFQLACDAGNAAAVARLRARKNRDAKPFAVMVPDLASAQGICEVDEAEAALLASGAAPIVLLRRRGPAAGLAADPMANGAADPASDEAASPGGIAAGVAPGLDTLGVMLPCTPLHHLLARGLGRALVMTSGNRSDEPIATGNVEAVERLGDIADAFLLHDRAIVSRYDDSVVRSDPSGPVVLRRARGYAPEPIRLARAAREPILALGAQLKNTVCLVRGRSAFVSQHIGDLDEALTLAHQRETVELYRRLFSIDPAVVAHDLHPDVAAARLPASLDELSRIAVQHHHAHIASVTAEHDVTEPVIGIAFDGTGYGSDGAVWGGELIIADWRGFRRLAHLRYLPLPGGDAAARRPWQMAVSALAVAFPGDADGDSAGEAGVLAAELLPRIPADAVRAVLRMARLGLRAPPTSSAGRLFDAVAALAGVRHVNGYEGNAAMELEASVDRAERGAYPLPLLDHPAGPAVWDSAELIRAVAADLRRGTMAGVVAARFHAGLAAAIAQGCRWARDREGLETVALSGGCFQNRLLLDSARARLETDGFTVLINRRVPPNDGGISLGQAAVALAASAG